MFKLRPHNAIDFYKADHRSQYPAGTNLIYSNFTPRSARHAKHTMDRFMSGVVVFGIQAFVKAFLMETWQREFFDRPRDEVVDYYKRRMDTSLGENAIKMDHMLALHDLGYLPIKIKALPEGSICPIGVPMLTIVNTRPEFFWLVNYLETALSACLWKAMTSATVAFQYRQLFEEYANATGGSLGFCQFQGHDFSFRGMSGMEDAQMSGAGHLLSFVGTDTVPAIDFMEDYYGADTTQELVGCSVPATEHSVMCMGTQWNEIETFKRLITEIYPAGIVSIVSDTWDFWKVVTEFVPHLRDQIMARDGKVVIRPDSGDPVRIVAGYLPHEVEQTENDGYISLATGDRLTEAEVKGAVQCLWDTFGGTTNALGYKTLDPHIGLIYGDSITLERADRILDLLQQKGFASDNVVFGIGSYTYEYTSRDAFGFAMKATYGEVNGYGRDIFKDPATDRGDKKSARGLLAVIDDQHGGLLLMQNCNKVTEDAGLLQVVFEDGHLLREHKLSEIRGRLLSRLPVARTRAA